MIGVSLGLKFPWPNDITTISPPPHLHFPRCHPSTMSNDILSSSPNPYRPYVVPLDASPHIISPSRSSSARDILADLDIPTDYLENPELSDLVSGFVTKGLSRYASTFLSQPFEVVKTTMQVQYLPKPGQRRIQPKQTRRTSQRRPLDYEDEFDDVHYYRGGC